MDAEPTLEKLALQAMVAMELAVEELDWLIAVELIELDASLEFAALLLELEGVGVGSGEFPPPPPQADINPLISMINATLTIFINRASLLLLNEEP